MALVKAVKYGSKLRLGMAGPSGSGKSYTGLTLACAIAKLTGKRAACVDTERGSARLYADVFDFDTEEPDSFDPRRLVKTIDEIERGGQHSVLLVDGLSPYWNGKDGALEQVDKAKSGNNSFSGWKTVTPMHNALVDRLLSTSMHVIVTLRSKTEWIIEEDGKGRKVPKKIGTAPVMRDGIEYEFGVFMELDTTNTATVTKTRCPRLFGKSYSPVDESLAVTLIEWLDGKEAPAPPVEPGPTTEPDKPLTIEEFREELSVLYNKCVNQVGFVDEMARLGGKKAADFAAGRRREVLASMEDYVKAVAA